MQLTDLRACVKIAKEDNLILVVDNTFSSPYLQNPLDLGADIVVHSVTKFINGHADIVGGIIVTKTEKLYKESAPHDGNLGCRHGSTPGLSGFEEELKHCRFVLIELRRVLELLQNGLKNTLEWNGVKYPGLKSHPQRYLALQQMKGFGSTISFGLKGGL